MPAEDGVKSSPGNKGILHFELERTGRLGSCPCARAYQIAGHICWSSLFSGVHCCHEHVFTIRVMHAGAIFLQEKSETWFGICSSPSPFLGQGVFVFTVFYFLVETVYDSAIR